MQLLSTSRVPQYSVSGRHSIGALESALADGGAFLGPPEATDITGGEEDDDGDESGLEETVGKILAAAVLLHLGLEERERERERATLDWRSLRDKLRCIFMGTLMRNSLWGTSCLSVVGSKVLIARKNCLASLSQRGRFSGQVRRGKWETEH